MIVAVFRRGLAEAGLYALAAGTEQVAAQEQVRHNRIDDVIESTELRAMYGLATEHDLAHDPREIEIGSPESLLSALLR